MAPTPGTVNADVLIVLPVCGSPLNKNRGCWPDRFPAVYVPSRRLPASCPEIAIPNSVGLPDASDVNPEIVQSSRNNRAALLPPTSLLPLGKSQTNVPAK